MRASRRGNHDGSGWTWNEMSRATLIIVCFVVTFLCTILIGIGLFAPSWWTLDVTEYGQEWQFGLWLYCRRGGMRHEVGQTGFDLRQWICDLRRADTLASRTQNREQSSFVDVDHNEVAVLICLSITFFCLIAAMFALCFAYWKKFLPACIAVMNFVGSKSASQVVHILVVVCGLVGLLIYVISMQDVQARRFTSYNSVYMSYYGYAAYCAIVGVVLCIVNFAITIPIVLLTFIYNRDEPKEPNRPDDHLDGHQLLPQQQRGEHHNREQPQAGQYQPHHPR